MEFRACLPAGPPYLFSGSHLVVVLASVHFVNSVELGLKRGEAVLGYYDDIIANELSAYFDDGRITRLVDG